MRMLTSKKAEMFDKALGDLWSAEQIYRGRPDYAVWHCEQCAEKLLKGILLCYGKDYDHTHDIAALLEECLEISGLVLEEELQEDILYINRFGNSIRYKNRKSDPDEALAKGILSRMTRICDRISKIAIVQEPYAEAKRLLDKI